MYIDDINFGMMVYYPRMSKQVIVIGIDFKNEYITVQDNERNRYQVHVSELRPVVDDQDMDIDDILRREG